MKLFIPVSLCILLAACESSSGYSDYATTYQQTKLTLEQQEQQNPEQFLKASGTYRKNLLGEWVLEGTVRSSASVAAYKDAVLNITFYSPTESVIGTQTEMLYQYFQPGSEQQFKVKVQGYSGTASIGYDVIGATAL